MTDHKRLSNKEVEAKYLEASKRVPELSGWKHRKTGAEYLAMSVAMREADLEPQVVYKPGGELYFFVRPLSEFLDKFDRIDA